MGYLRFLRDNLRWIAGGFLLTLFSSFGQTFFISLWGGDLRAEFDLSHGDFGSIYMVSTLASAATLTILGRIVDRVSVAVVAVGVIVMLGITAIGMSMVNSVPMLIVLIFMLRLFGQGMMTHTAMTAMGRWYAKNRGKAVSITTLGHQAGEAALPISFVAMAAVVGWRTSWLIAGGLVLCIALPVIFGLMRRERTPKSQDDDEFEDVSEQRQWQRGEVLKDHLFWLVCIGIMAPAFIGTSIFFHQIYLIELKGWSVELFASSFAVMAITTASLALISGILIDRFSARALLPWFLSPLAMGCLVLAWFSSPLAIIAFMFLQGVSYGISSALFGALWPEIYGTRHLGAVRSVIVALMVLSSALGPGVTGLLIDQGIAFTSQLEVIVVYLIAASVILYFVERAISARHLAEPVRGVS
ncbi:MAG: MFS transporter [Pseudomonadota bacterium]